MKRLALLFGILILAPQLCAQINPILTGSGLGLPQFGTLESGPADTVNLHNLNEFISIPIASNPGRGLSLNFAVTYNSNFWVDWGAKWAPVSSPTLTWGWNTTQAIGQAVYFTNSIRRCAVGTTWYDSRTTWRLITLSPTEQAMDSNKLHVYSSAVPGERLLRNAGRYCK